MTGDDLGPTDIPFDRSRLMRTVFILGTELGALSIEVKMLITRDGPLDEEDKGHIQLARSEIADLIFQATKLAKELGLEDPVHILYRMGEAKYNEKMEEYREYGREWI